MRSAGILESHAYLASAAAMLPLQNAILANLCSTTSDPADSDAKEFSSLRTVSAAGSSVKVASQIRLLGVTLDVNLNFNAQIKMYAGHRISTSER